MTRTVRRIAAVLTVIMLVSTQLAAAAAEIRYDTAWSPPAAAVSADTQTISSQALLDAAVAAVRKLAPADAVVSPSGGGWPRELSVPAGNVEIRASVLHGIRYNASTLVEVAVFVDGSMADKTGVRLDVKLYRKVLAAARPLKTGEVLTADALTLVQGDVHRLPANVLLDLKQTVGLSVRQPVAQGAILTAAMVEKPVLIKSGMTVFIRARSGAVEVTIAGVAMQNGVMGQLIRVRNAVSGRILAGRVADDSTVDVITENNG